MLDSLLLFQEQYPCQLFSVMVQVPSSWISLTAEGQRILCWNVMHLHLVACPSVTIPRMSESGVEVGYMVVGLKCIYLPIREVHCTISDYVAIQITW